MAFVLYVFSMLLFWWQNMLSPPPPTQKGHMLLVLVGISEKYKRLSASAFTFKAIF